MNLTEKKEWRGDYKGIPFEIVFWSNEHMQQPEQRDIYAHKGIWNSYIFIRKDNVPNRFNELIPTTRDDSYKPGRKWYNYSEVDDFFDMAYGMTFFEVFRDQFSGEITGIKVGNDYNHLWNDGQYIDEKTVLEDVQKSVDKFIEQFPEYLVRSSVTGEYVKPEELEEYDKTEHAKLFPKSSTPLPNAA